MWMKFAVPNRSVSFRIVNIAGTFGHGILVLNERSEHQRAFGYVEILELLELALGVEVVLGHAD
jgi:hypothetical protein